MTFSKNNDFANAHSENLVRKNYNIECETSIKKIAGGDISALTSLYDKLKRPVFLLAYSILHDYSLAEDVTQETFLHVTDKASAYHPGTNPKAWIFTIARNIAFSAVRDRKKEELSDFETTGVQMGAEDAVIADADFDRAISVLDSDERNIVILRIEASLKHREIAKIMGISYADARVKYFRALKKLKKYYEKQ